MVPCQVNRLILLILCVALVVMLILVAVYASRTSTSTNQQQAKSVWVSEHCGVFRPAAAAAVVPYAIHNPALTLQHFKLLSPMRPHLAVLDDFLSPAHCQHLIDLGRPHLRESRVVGGRGGSDAVDSRYRSSLSAYLTKGLTPMLREIEDAVCRLLSVHRRQLESLQVVRYTQGQQFKQHHDYFHYKDTDKRGGQRVHTLLAYLNTLEPSAGGATYFPRINVRIYPRQGRVVYFRNTTDDGKVTDEYTLHSGEALLTNTEKFACNIWTRSQMSY